MPHQKVVIAVGRELLGFIWAIGVHVERQQDECRSLLAQKPSPMSSYRAASDRGHDEKENPRDFLCGRASARTRASSERQLPTDHDHEGELALDPRIAD